MTPDKNRLAISALLVTVLSLTTLVGYAVGHVYTSVRVRKPDPACVADVKAASFKGENPPTLQTVTAQCSATRSSGVSFLGMGMGFGASSASSK